MYIGNQPYQVAFLTDQFSGNGSTTAFTMSVAPANTSSVLVVVSGVVQDPSTYSVSGTTLTFSQAPPTGTGNISARYLGIPASNVTTTAYRTVTNFTATSGQTTFTPPSYTAGFINVFRDGVYLTTLDYTATNGTTVVLNNAVPAGVTITVESFLVSSVLNAIPATAGAVNSTYLAGGAALANIGAGGLTQTYLGANVAGNGPAFSAYLATNQTVTANTFTKVTINTKSFDTNNNFDASTNYRFTPTVAGYYQVNASLAIGTTNNGILSIYKNGSATLYQLIVTNTLSSIQNVSTLIYLNGSTDYIELYGYTSATTFFGGALNTTFSASMVRSA